MENKDSKSLGNSNPKQQVFYTQEGTPYYVRRVSKVIGEFDYTDPGNSANIYLVAVFNPASSITDWSTFSPKGTINLDNTKKVIPVMFNYQAIIATDPNGAQRTVANLSLPYYSVRSSNALSGLGNFRNLLPLTKMSPMIEMVEASNPTTLVYGCKYTQVSFSDEDFIETQGGAAFLFCQSQSNAYSNTPTYYTLQSPGDTKVYAVATFLYLELQTR